MEKTEESPSEPPTPVDLQPNPPYYSRTPSVDPPTFALLAQEQRTSLLSLLNAPHEGDSHCVMPAMPTTPAEAPTSEEQDEDQTPQPSSHGETATPQDARPHTSAAFYTVTTTTTVPVRESTRRPPQPTKETARTPSFDVNNPAMTPTMTREQALAQIQERRGRARSAAQGAAHTPRRQMLSATGSRRDASAPAARAVKGRSA